MTYPKAASGARREQAPCNIITTIKFSIGDVHEPTQVIIVQGFHRYIREAVSPVLTFTELFTDFVRSRDFKLLLRAIWSERPVDRMSIAAIKSTATKTKLQYI